MPLELDAPDPGASEPPAVRVNSVPCGKGEATGKNVFTYSVPAAAFAPAAQVVEASSDVEMRLIRVEFAISGAN